MDTSEVTEARFLFVINFSYLSLWRIALLSAAIFKYIYRTNISPENRNEEKQKSKPFFRWHNTVGKEKKAKNFDGINRSCTLLIKWSKIYTDIKFMW